MSRNFSKTALGQIQEVAKYVKHRIDNDSMLLDLIDGTVCDIKKLEETRDKTTDPTELESINNKIRKTINSLSRLAKKDDDPNLPHIDMYELEPAICANETVPQHDMLPFEHIPTFANIPAHIPAPVPAIMQTPFAHPYVPSYVPAPPYMSPCVPAPMFMQMPTFRPVISDTLTKPTVCGKCMEFESTHDDSKCAERSVIVAKNRVGTCGCGGFVMDHIVNLCHACRINQVESRALRFPMGIGGCHGEQNGQPCAEYAMHESNYCHTCKIRHYDSLRWQIMKHQQKTQ